MIQSTIEMNQVWLNDKNTEPYNPTFEKLLTKAVEKAFSSLFHSQKQNLYSYLSGCYNISKQDIPYTVDDFANALQDIFGSGAKLVEIEMMKSLHELVKNTTFAPNNGDLSFTEYVRAIHGLSHNQLFSDCIDFVGHRKQLVR